MQVLSNRTNSTPFEAFQSNCTRVVLRDLTDFVPWEKFCQVIFVCWGCSGWLVKSGVLQRGLGGDIYSLRQGVLSAAFLLKP